MARVKRSVGARKKRRKVLDQASGYWGDQALLLQAREGAGPALAALRLPRPPGAQARLPAPLDRPHQRRARARTASPTASSSTACKLAEVELDRKILAELATHEPDGLRRALRPRPRGPRDGVAAGRASRRGRRRACGFRAHRSPACSNAVVQQSGGVCGAASARGSVRAPTWRRATTSSRPASPPASARGVLVRCRVAPARRPAAAGARRGRYL